MGNTVFGRNLAKRRKALGLTTGTACHAAERLATGGVQVGKQQLSGRRRGRIVKKTKACIFCAAAASGDTGCFFG